MNHFRFLYNILSLITPPTRMFGLRRFFAKIVGVNVGKGTRLAGGINFYGSGPIDIGENCWIGIGCKFYTSPNVGIYIGNCCDIAPDVVFHNGTHDFGSSARRAGRGFGEKICIGDGVWIGVRSTVLYGCIVGDGCLVGAGSLLKKGEFKRNSIIYGHPAKLKGEFK